MAISKRLLSAGLVTVSFTGFVMASQWGYAAEPPAYPMVATAEMMQLLRDEHDLVAEMIWGSIVGGTRPVQGIEDGYHHLCATAE